ncbi:hypothetical protein Aduo_017166 [Ancylostoma duodenale]
MSWRTLVINTLKPSNHELRSVIEAALWKNFKNVQVEVTACPDLTAAPFHMTSSGFGRNLVIADVGGWGNLFPNLHKEKLYDIKEVCNTCGAPKAFVFGPGGCPPSAVGVNGELVADANLSENKVASKVTIQLDNYTTPYKTLLVNSTKFVLMGNLAITPEPGPAEVVHVKCSQRTGRDSFPKCIRKHLAQHYGQCCVSLAGIFLLLRGKADVHIAPDFPDKPFKSMEEVDKWLQTFNVSAPLIGACVLHSYDPGYKLRMEHTHCYSDHDDAGHFYDDTTPEQAEYEGWFTAAEKIYRIDEI